MFLTLIYRYGAYQHIYISTYTDMQTLKLSFIGYKMATIEEKKKALVQAQLELRLAEIEAAHDWAERFVHIDGDGDTRVSRPFSITSLDEKRTIEKDFKEGIARRSSLIREFHSIYDKYGIPRPRPTTITKYLEQYATKVHAYTVYATSAIKQDPRQSLVEYCPIRHAWRTHDYWARHWRDFEATMSGTDVDAEYKAFLETLKQTVI